MAKCGKMCDFCVDPGATTNKASQAKAEASGKTLIKRGGMLGL